MSKPDSKNILIVKLFIELGKAVVDGNTDKVDKIVQIMETSLKENKPITSETLGL